MAQKFVMFNGHRIPANQMHRKYQYIYEKQRMLRDLRAKRELENMDETEFNEDDDLNQYGA